MVHLCVCCLLMKCVCVCVCPPRRQPEPEAVMSQSTSGVNLSFKNVFMMSLPVDTHCLLCLACVYIKTESSSVVGSQPSDDCSAPCDVTVVKTLQVNSVFLHPAVTYPSCYIFYITNILVSTYSVCCTSIVHTWRLS